MSMNVYSKEDMWEAWEEGYRAGRFDELRGNDDLADATNPYDDWV